MTGLAYRHVDVFASAPLSGNGLTVVFDADQLSTATMQALTIEFRQFETIFLSAVDPAARSASARIFTMQEELDFAGHPIVGAGAALAERTRAHGSWTIVVGGRPLQVDVEHDAMRWQATMAQGRATHGPVVDGTGLDALLASLSLDPSDMVSGLKSRVVSTGLPYLIVPVTAAGLARAQIVGDALDAQLAGVGARFVYVLDPVAREGRTWDNLGAVEDAATGSAAGPSAAYLIAAGLAPVQTDFTIVQGRFVSRPSAMTVRVDDDGAVSVGGAVFGVAAGTIDAGAMALP